MQKEPMTIFGYTKLENELNNLKKVQRPQIIVEIDVARSHGDLKENAEYHAAREKQAFIESRIAEFTNILSNTQIIDPSSYIHDRVLFGSTVKLENLDNEKIMTYTIVGAYESNPEKGLISIASPLAKQIIGKRVGDEVDIQLPSGRASYEVLEVFFRPIDFKDQE